MDSLVEYLSISERARLVSIGIDELLEAGVRVVNVTCDSPRVQLAMMKELGANLDPECLDLHICKDKPGNPIYFIHDMCHVMKLIRNAWGEKHKKFKDSNGDIIDWQYIIELYKLQCKIQLKCANKLTQNHVYFYNCKMKVKFAVQVMSRSVALSLKFCREQGYPQFKGSEATEKFLFFMNNIFDILNTNTKYSMWPLKRAMSLDNYSEWRPVLIKTYAYVSNLTTINNVSLTKDDSRKTGFVGILCNIRAVELIFNDIVTFGPMNFICTLKMSQDPLEHFFGWFRARYGANNNPTPYQFKKTFRKILFGVTHKIVTNSNVYVDENLELISVIPSVQNKIEFIYDKYDLGNPHFIFLVLTLSCWRTYLIIFFLGGGIINKMRNFGFSKHRRH